MAGIKSNGYGVAGGAVERREPVLSGTQALQENDST